MHRRDLCNHPQPKTTCPLPESKYVHQKQFLRGAEGFSYLVCGPYGDVVVPLFDGVEIRWVETRSQREALLRVPLSLPHPPHEVAEPLLKIVIGHERQRRRASLPSNQTVDEEDLGVLLML